MIIRSQRVRAADFDTEWFKSRAIELGQESDRYHRKVWEFVVIAQTFIDHVLEPAVSRWQHTSTKPNLKALGFGCGKEPIPRWLAQSMVNVIATDAPEWLNPDEHAQSLADLGLDSDNPFVSFRAVDMNSIPDDLLQGQFDFTWSCGSFEHIGGIDQSIEFFRNQMRCLKPGGIACHTTEFNFRSSRGFGGHDPTIEWSDLVLFRCRDLATLSGRLWAQGDTLWLPDFEPGTSAADQYIDIEPYDRGPFHLSLRINEHVTTSIVLIATRGNKNGDTRS